MDRKYALVTGASKGIGFGYCEELLKRGFSLIGVARDTKPLNIFQEKYPDADIVLLNYDLSISENNLELFSKVKDYNIELLINNAGFGVWGFFNSTSLEQEMNMIDLNIKSLHTLTKLFSQYFVEKQKGRIINIASIAAFSPGPVFASYFASKAYVLSLGVAVNTELIKTKTPVRVVTICPGPITTDFWDRSDFKKDSKKKVKIKGMNAQKFCAKSIKKALKKRPRNKILVGSKNKLLVWGMKNLSEKFILNQTYKQLKNEK